MAAECTNCRHPPHAGRVCRCPITETIRDDVGFFAPPTHIERTIITKTCSCGYVPGECGHRGGLKSWDSSPPVLICTDCGDDVSALFNPT